MAITAEQEREIQRLVAEEGLTRHQAEALVTDPLSIAPFDIVLGPDGKPVSPTW